MSIILLFLLILFFFFNYIVSGYKILAPNVVFCLAFFISSLGCLFGVYTYGNEIHIQTVMVIISGVFIFSIVACLSSFFTKKRRIVKHNITPIYVSNFFYVAFIVAQIICIFFQYRYIRDIARAYGSNSENLLSIINLFNVLSKSRTFDLADLKVQYHRVFKLLYPFVKSLIYVIYYITIRNFLAKKRVNILCLFSIILDCIFVLMFGSRSPLFRILTALFIIYYYTSRYSSERVKTHPLRFAAKLLGAIGIGIGLLWASTIFIGRVIDFDISQYLYIYIGAPIYNLDTYLMGKTATISPRLFGEQTFRGLYYVLGARFGIDEWIYKNINDFVYNKGILLGNVYTTYYFFIYDFGYLGIIPLMFVISIYYCKAYKKIVNQKNTSSDALRLTVYAYLFNDLIMLPFSCRFYESILDGFFYKFVIINWVFFAILIDGKLSIFGKKIAIIKIGKQQKTINTIYDLIG